MLNPKPRICIIENGRTPDDLIGQFGSYPEMIAKWIGRSMPEAEYQFISPVTGEKLPSPEDYDGYILSGSKHSTYERAEWMIELIDFLQELRAKRIPVFGICFGHQIMADAYGGKNTKSPRGWGVGAQIYHYEGGAFPATCTSYVFHQDQVTEVPAEAKVIGGSTHCLNGVFEYSFPAFSVQYHPEFSGEYISALTKKFRGNLLANSVSVCALDSIERLVVDARVVGEKAAAFFRSNYRYDKPVESEGERYG